MRKVIETNISLDNVGNQADFQSRVIEVESWESYIEEIKNPTSKVKSDVFGCLNGTIMPRFTKASNLVYSDFHLSCYFSNQFGLNGKKLAYLIDERNK